MATIKMKRGLDTAIKNTVLAIGEFGIATDTGNVYVGIESGNYWVNPPALVVEEAVKLKHTRSFSVRGDGTAAAVPFDGTADVAMTFQLADMGGLSAGTYTKLTVDKKGRVTAGAGLETADLPAVPAGKITGLGTAAGLDVGTSAGKVVVVGEDGVIPEGLLPAVAVSDTFEADSEAAMLALTAQRGDLCIRSDERKSYILTQSPASALENWKWLKTPDCNILSVNGQTGTVVLTASAVGAAPEGHVSAVAGAGLGHVRSGGGVTVEADGALTVSAIDGGVIA